MPVCTPLGQGLSAQLLVEEGNGKPPHHHPSSHFPSLDDTGVSPLSVITDLPYGRALIIINYTYTTYFPFKAKMMSLTAYSSFIIADSHFYHNLFAIQMYNSFLLYTVGHKSEARAFKQTCDF